MQTLKIQEWAEFSWRNNVYNAEVSVETHLEYGFAIECTYFQRISLFAHYCHYYSL